MSCGKKVADEEQIQIDLEAFTQKSILNNGEKIIEIAIDKRQTQKDEKLDTVWCTVQTEDERCEYEKSFVLTYSLYDEGGWILDEVSVSDRSSWVITPLTGVSDDEISASLIGIDVMVNDEIWRVTKENMKIEAGDIIGEKPYKWFKPSDITAKLNVDDSSISGRADLQFTFTQQ